MPAVISGQRTLAKNLREAYAGAVRQKGPVEGEIEFKKHVSKLNAKHGLTGAPGSTPRFSLRALAEGILGEDWETRMKLGCVHLQRGLMESQGAVDVSAFSSITGQLLVDRINDNYNAPEFIGDSLFEIAPITNGNIGPHVVPWLSRVKDDPGVLQPQQEYPETQFVEQYITLPAAEKRGLKVSVSMEMIFADKTKQATDRADDVGFRTRYNREERQLKVVAGIVNNFKYMGTAYNTYQTSGLWINKKSSNVITQYQQIAELELLLSNMTDLVTGKAIQIDPKAMRLLCTPYKLPEIKIAFHAARTRSGPFAASGATNTQTEFEGVPRIYDVDYPIVSSAILWHLLTDTAAAGGQAVSANNAKEYVFLGNFQRAFIYREAMPYSTEQAPPGNPAEFNQDIIVQVKAREWGVAGVQGPQQVIWSLNA